MKQAEVINKYEALQNRAEAVGLTLKIKCDQFLFTAVPGSGGIIAFGDLHEVERFLRGYELGYKSGL